MAVNPYLAPFEKERLDSARIGVAGAGGLGSNAAAHLVRAGVRKLVIADFDVVCESNLNRQFYFRDQIGRAKVDALAENLRRIEPDLELTLCREKLDGPKAAKVFIGCDLVIEAFDSAAAKASLYRALRDKPVVGASGIAGFGRSAAVTLHRIGKNLFIAGDGESGVSQTLAPQSARVGIAAAIEANTALAVLLGEEP